MNKYYIAYGSNMNTEDMKKRCKTAKVIGTTKLSNYRLMFNRYATIVKDPASSVPVVIWEISEEDEANLDKYESFPKLYHKEYITLYIDNAKSEAMVYIMNDFVSIAPSKQYFKTILSAYAKYNFDTDCLKEALASTVVISEFYDDELCSEFVNSYFHNLDITTLPIN